MKGIFEYDSPLMTALTSIGDCICLSILWIVFSLPVVTVGASTTALYSAAYHTVRKKEGALWSRFWGTFKEDFKRSTLLWLPVFAVLALLTVDVFGLRSVPLSAATLRALYYVLLVLWSLALTWGIYVAAYAARFNGSAGEVLKFSVMLMALHPVKMLGVLLPAMAGLALTLLVPFMALILPAAMFVVFSFTTERVFRLHMRPEDLERQEASERSESEEEKDFNDQ